MPDENNATQAVLVTTLPLEWKPLRVEAERLARELHEDGRGAAWEHLSEPLRGTLEWKQARLLAKLTRPESRDLWWRWWVNRQPPRKGEWLAVYHAAIYRDDFAVLLHELARTDPALAALLGVNDA